MNSGTPVPTFRSLPDSARTLLLSPGPAVGISTQLPPKDWPHAPVHRLSENAVYIVTAGTFNKKPFFDADTKRDLRESMLLCMSKQHGCQLEARAGMGNHYH